MNLLLLPNRVLKIIFIIHKKNFHIFFIPLNIRDILKAAAEPLLVNWPSDISRKKSGVPIRKYIQKYGIRKAPIMIRSCIFKKNGFKIDLPPPFLNARKWKISERCILSWIPYQCMDIARHYRDLIKKKYVG